jgi:drug/metabolite transporter (DMT)-like permease
MNKNTRKSIVAMFAGAITGIVLSIGTDLLLHAAGVFPPLSQSQPMSDSLFLLATAYRTIYGVLGAYITARLAPSRPMGHALILGAIGLAVCILGTVVTWSEGPAFGPHWYPLALVALAMPQSWLGAKFRELQLHATTIAS